MKNDMITLFNQLTSKELADYTLFSHIVDLHYEKFKYLYYMIKDIDLSAIQNITCVEDDTSINVTIIPQDISVLWDITDDICVRESTYKKRSYFVTDITSHSDCINISIRMSGNEKEGDIYANRLI